MKIDAHQHFWRYDPRRDSWITPEMVMLQRDFLPSNLAGELHSSGIQACIAVQADQSEAETLFLLQLAEQCPEIVGVVGWVDLRSPGLHDRLEYFSRFPRLVGFRHIVQAEPDDSFLRREDFLRGVALLSEFGFTYDILIYPKHLHAAVEFVRRLPGQRLVLDHMAKPQIKSAEIREWAAQIKAMAELPNVHCKVSGLVTEAEWKKWKPEDFKPYLDVVFAAFGTQRLMFGSDWPVCLLSGTYAAVMALVENYMSDFSQAERDAVFGLNAHRFYHREVSRHGSAA
jgi:L-fuconolactonase